MKQCTEGPCAAPLAGSPDYVFAFVLGQLMFHSNYKKGCHLGLDLGFDLGFDLAFDLGFDLGFDFTFDLHLTFDSTLDRW